jgi:arylsulfatase A-like enzyme
MRRRDFLSLAAASVISARPVSKPNILLLMADQFRGDALHCDGNDQIFTPNLDRIAADGARFRCAYSSTPTCTPARAALLTGLSPWRHGLLGYGKIADRYPVEMPRLLKSSGYFTSVIGKCHYTPQRNSHGFDEALLDESGREESVDFRSDYRSWFWSIAPQANPDETGIGWNDYRAAPYALPQELHPTNWIGTTAVKFLESYQRPQPFFLQVSFERPHSPYDPPKRWWKHYENADLPKAQAGEWAKRYAPRSGPGYEIWHGDLGGEQVRSSRQGYYGSVSHVDEQIGRVMEALEKRGWLEETLVVFVSDHGDMTGDQNLWRKSYAYEPSARIPLLVRWPKGLFSAERGAVRAEPVEIRDLLPTFLDVARVPEKSEKLDGRSLLDILRGARDWRSYIDLEHDVCYSPANHWNALTDGRMKYIFHARDGNEQLFDLTQDSHELISIDSNSTMSLWRERLVNHLAERGERFVKKGRLALRPESYLYSPHYPSGSGMRG